MFLRATVGLAACLATQAWAGVTVALTGPADGSVHQAGANITLSATATANKGYTLSKVEFFQGTTLIGTDTSAPYSIVWNSVPAGNYSLTAKATATKKNKPDQTAFSAAVNITVSANTLLLHFIHVDHLNTPRLVTNQSGQTVWRWDQQEPFGNNAPDGNPSGLGAFEFPLRFPGQYFDKETNFYYNYFRDYDPSIGRYGQSDPIGLRGGLSTYAYAASSPILLIDAIGLAYFAKRPLYRTPWLAWASCLPGSPDDRNNTEISHEHLFFEDGKSPPNLGYGPQGLFTEGNPTGYRCRSEKYNDCIMRKAAANVRPKRYCLLGEPGKPRYNCQDWADEVRAEYGRLVADLEVRKECLECRP